MTLQPTTTVPTQRDGWADFQNIGAAELPRVNLERAQRENSSGSQIHFVNQHGSEQHNDLEPAAERVLPPHLEKVKDILADHGSLPKAIQRSGIGRDAIGTLSEVIAFRAALGNQVPNDWGVNREISEFIGKIMGQSGQARMDRAGLLTLRDELCSEYEAKIQRDQAEAQSVAEAQQRLAAEKAAEAAARRAAQRAAAQPAAAPETSPEPDAATAPAAAAEDGTATLPGGATQVSLEIDTAESPEEVQEPAAPAAPQTDTQVDETLTNLRTALSARTSGWQILEILDELSAEQVKQVVDRWQEEGSTTLHSAVHSLVTNTTARQAIEARISNEPVQIVQATHAILNSREKETITAGAWQAAPVEVPISGKIIRQRIEQLWKNLTEEQQEEAREKYRTSRSVDAEKALLGSSKGGHLKGSDLIAVTKMIAPEHTQSLWHQAALTLRGDELINAAKEIWNEQLEEAAIISAARLFDARHGDLFSFKDTKTFSEILDPNAKRPEELKKIAQAFEKIFGGVVSDEINTVRDLINSEYWSIPTKIATALDVIDRRGP